MTRPNTNINDKHVDFAPEVLTFTFLMTMSNSIKQVQLKKVPRKAPGDFRARCLLSTQRLLYNWSHHLEDEIAFEMFVCKWQKKELRSFYDSGVNKVISTGKISLRLYRKIRLYHQFCVFCQKLIPVYIWLILAISKTISN